MQTGDNRARRKCKIVALQEFAPHMQIGPHVGRSRSPALGQAAIGRKPIAAIGGPEAVVALVDKARADVRCGDVGSKRFDRAVGMNEGADHVPEIGVREQPFDFFKVIGKPKIVVADMRDMVAGP